MGQLTTNRNTAASTRLDTDLKPASDREIFDELEALFLAFGMDAEKLGAKRVALFVDACRGEPVWAIRKGIRAIRNGHDDGKTTDYLPSTQRVARAVRGESEWAREQEAKRQRDERIRREHIAAIEEAKGSGPVPPELRARVQALVMKSKEAMK